MGDDSLDLLGEGGVCAGGAQEVVNDAGGVLARGEVFAVADVVEEGGEGDDVVVEGWGGGGGGGDAVGEGEDAEDVGKIVGGVVVGHVGFCVGAGGGNEGVHGGRVCCAGL